MGRGAGAAMGRGAPAVKGRGCGRGAAKGREAATGGLVSGRPTGT